MAENRKLSQTEDDFSWYFGAKKAADYNQVNSFSTLVLLVKIELIKSLKIKENFIAIKI